MNWQSRRLCRLHFQVSYKFPPRRNRLDDVLYVIYVVSRIFEVRAQLIHSLPARHE
jgi:hypothetical protein